MGLPLLAVSGEEIAGALQRAGFHVVSRGPAATTLSHACRDLTVPIGPIAPETLRDLLRAAGLSYSSFLDMLEASPPPDPARTSQVRRRVRIADDT